MPELPPQILREFLDQSTGLLDRVDRDLADVDRTGDPSLGKGISSAFRSIRSGAAFLELAELEAAATRAEALLREFKAESMEVARRELASLRQAVGALRSGASVAATEIIPDASEPDRGAIDAADRVESFFENAPAAAEIDRPEPEIEAAPVVATSGKRTLARLLEQAQTVVANVAARTSCDLRAEVRGGEVEADDAVCQALHSALAVIVAHASSHTAASCDPSQVAPTIRISAELEGTQVCIRVESPVSTLDSWASDPHLEAARNAVESMMGSLTLAADGPSATSVVLRVPANPASFPAMIVRAGEGACALPAAQVDQVIPAAGAQISVHHGVRSVEFRGEVIPLLDARRLFAHAVADSAGRHIVILRAVGRRIALGVDRALGVQEVTLRAGDAAATTAANRGWATLADGSLSLIVDVPALARSVETHEPRLAVAA